MLTSQGKKHTQCEHPCSPSVVDGVVFQVCRRSVSSCLCLTCASSPWRRLPLWASTATTSRFLPLCSISYATISTPKPPKPIIFSISVSVCVCVRMHQCPCVCFCVCVSLSVFPYLSVCLWLWLCSRAYMYDFKPISLFLCVCWASLSLSLSPCTS